MARETGRKTKITRQFPDQRIVRNHKCLSGMYTFPSKCFQTSSRMCSRLSVGLLSYDGGSTLIRLDRSKKLVGLSVIRLPSLFALVLQSLPFDFFSHCKLTELQFHVTRRSSSFETVATLLVARKQLESCLLYTSPSPRDGLLSRMPSSA